MGGAYINGTAEVVGRDGIAWAVAPASYTIGIVIGMDYILVHTIIVFILSAIELCS